MSELAKHNTVGDIRTLFMKSATAGLGAASLLAGCSGGETPAPVDSSPAPIVCTGERIKEWTGVPNSLNIDSLAEKLDVDPSKLAAGAIVMASCEAGIPLTEFFAGRIITIKGIPGILPVSDQCLTVFSDTASPGATVHHVGAACPAQ
jgi:hypothetical protein